MVRAICCMRTTSAMYSSCRPGMRRERKTVTIMAGSWRMALPRMGPFGAFHPIQVCDGIHAGRRWLLRLHSVCSGEIMDPALLRTRPELNLGHEAVALADRSGADHVELRPGVRRG